MKEQQTGGREEQERRSYLAEIFQILRVLEIFQILRASTQEVKSPHVVADVVVAKRQTPK